MGRHRGQKSLYEAMSKTGDKSRPSSILDRLRSAPTAESNHPEPTKVEAPPPIAPPTPWRGPKALQFNAGRIEISIPYQLAIAFALGLVLIIVLAYWLGQARPKAAKGPEGSTRTNARSPGTDGATRGQPTGSPFGTGQTQGNYVIVIAEYSRQIDLEYVRQHFMEAGIATRITQRGNKFVLETSNMYDDPEKSGTNGFLAKQKIIEVGAKYKGKAPRGYETFAPNFFKTASGMKVK